MALGELMDGVGAMKAHCEERIPPRTWRKTAAPPRKEAAAGAEAPLQLRSMRHD